jgi:hypothetical protein
MVATGWLGKAAVAPFVELPPLVTLVVLGSVSGGAYLLALWLGFPACAREMRELLRRRKADQQKRQEGAAQNGNGAVL